MIIDADVKWWLIKVIDIEHNHPPDPFLAIEYGGDLDLLEDDNKGGIEYLNQLKEAWEK
jgi:hypothetical protein